MYIQIFRDDFETMLLITIKGYSYNYQRQAIINDERIACADDGWNYSACYEEKNKTYLVFTKEERISKQLPVYC